MADSCGKSLTLTGTLTGGYSSTLFHLIGNSVFLRLSDVASGLPPYEEQVLLSGMPGIGLHRLLPAQGLRPSVRHPAAGAGRGSGQGFQALAGDLPPDPPGLPRRLQPGARRSSTPRPATSWSRCRLCRRTSSIPRSRRWWT